MTQELRDAFLKKAACFALLDSPSTSAFLMAESFDSLAASNLAISPALKATCCSACGCLFVPGWTAIQARQSQQSYADEFVERSSRQVPRKNVVHQCCLCHRKSVITTKKPGGLQKGKTANSNKPVAARPPPEGSSSVKSTAKQRAKDRKLNQGLQALMSSRSKRETAASTPSFDLMDFMKA
jgi:hypothetical protein